MKKIIYSVLLLFSVTAISQGLHADKGRRIFIKTSPAQSATASKSTTTSNRGSYNPCSVAGKKVVTGQTAGGQTTRIKLYKTEAVLGKNVLLRGRLLLKLANRSLQNQAVKFYINGKYLGGTKTNRIGLARMTYRPSLNLRLKNGYFFLKIEYAGHGKCQKTYSIIGISARIPTTISLEFPNKPVLYQPSKGQISLYIKGILQSKVGNQGIFGREVQFKFNNKLIKRLGSGETGRFNYSYGVPRNFLGQVKVVALFPGDKKYASTAKRFSFNIKKKVQANKKGYVIFRLPQHYKVKVGQTINLSARVKSKSSSWPLQTSLSQRPNIKGAKVSWLLTWGRRDNFRKWLGNAYTDKNGIATLKVMINERPDYYRITALASHPEYAQIKKSKAAGFGLIKSPVYITVKGAKRGKIGDTLNLTMTVSRVTDLAPVAKARVLGFGIDEYVTTDSNGKAILNIYLSPGMLGQKTHSVRSEETNSYLSGKRNFKITTFPRAD